MLMYMEVIIGENDYITIKLMSKNPLLFHLIFVVITKWPRLYFFGGSHVRLDGQMFAVVDDGDDDGDVGSDLIWSFDSMIIQLTGGNEEKERQKRDWTNYHLEYMFGF